LAILLPTTLGGLAATAVAILVAIALTVGVSVAETLAARPFIAAGGRFTQTLAATRAILDLQRPTAAALWLGTLLLLAAAVVAIVVRLTLRERRGGGSGWGWLAAVFVAAACAAEVPVGGVVGGLIADITGIALGPSGIGWWFIVAGMAVGGIAAWALRSLTGRLGTATWLGLAAAAWLGSAACAWLGGNGAAGIWGTASWAVGAACACIAMLAAARTAIGATRGRSAMPARPPEQRPAATPRDHAAEVRAEESSFDQETEYVDGSTDHGAFRHLSKAERKRLKKLARLQRAG
jgi:hypothetical protein